MLEFRPHHFLCTLGFEGKGYSDAFVRGYQEIADQLRKHGSAGDTVEIQVAAATDSICAPCPNRRDTLCSTESRIRKLDEGHAAILGIQVGQVLSWGEAKKILAEKMTEEAFESVCAPCSWKALGVCKTALIKLKQDVGVILK